MAHRLAVVSIGVLVVVNWATVEDTLIVLTIDIQTTAGAYDVMENILLISPTDEALVPVQPNEANRLRKPIF
jgi:hypothetical protein